MHGRTVTQPSLHVKKYQDYNRIAGILVFPFRYSHTLIDGVLFVKRATFPQILVGIRLKPYNIFICFSLFLHADFVIYASLLSTTGRLW